MKLTETYCVCLSSGVFARIEEIAQHGRRKKIVFLGRLGGKVEHRVDFESVEESQEIFDKLKEKFELLDTPVHILDTTSKRSPAEEFHREHSLLNVPHDLAAQLNSVKAQEKAVDEIKNALADVDAELANPDLDADLYEEDDPPAKEA